MLTCFIAMPISTPDPSLYHGDGDHFEHVLEHLFVPAVKALGMEPIMPMAQGADIIQGEIIKHLEQADLVLCDISTLNANVFFEMGIRTALNRPVCIVRDQNTPRIPFDTTIVNHHTYDGTLQPWLLQEEVSALSRHLQKSFEKSDGKNTLWSYFGLTMRAEPSESGSDSNAHLALISQQLEKLTRRIDEGALSVVSDGEDLYRSTRKRQLQFSSNLFEKLKSDDESSLKEVAGKAVKILLSHGIKPIKVDASGHTLEVFLRHDPSFVLKNANQLEQDLRNTAKQGGFTGLEITNLDESGDVKTRVPVPL